MNYLLPLFVRYFSELTNIEGRIFAMSTIVNGWHKNLIETNPTTFRFLEAGTFYRDLSKRIGTDNLETLDFTYEITVNNIADEMENLVSRECGLTVSQAYETFESFLVDILTEYFYNNQLLLSEIGLVKETIIMAKEDIRTLLHRSSGKNNKGLVSLVRKMSSHFRMHEGSNYLGVNIVHWFDLLSMIRHALVHSRQVITPKFVKYLEDNQANASYQLFDRQFQRKVVDNRVCLLLNTRSTSDAISWLNSFAHLIFVSLSKESGLPVYRQVFD